MHNVPSDTAGVDECRTDAEVAERLRPSITSEPVIDCPEWLTGDPCNASRDPTDQRCRIGTQ